METGVATVVVHFHADPHSLITEWDSLADRTGTVFSSRPGFVLNVVDATKLDCEYVTVRRGGRLVALAALSKVKRGPLTLAKVVGTNLGVPLEILSEDSDASDSLLRAVAERGYMLSADSMIANGLTMHRLLSHSSWNVHAPVRESVPVIELGVGQGASSIRGTKSLKRLRQYRNSVTSFGIEVVTDAEHLQRRWADIDRVAATAIEGTTRINYLVSPHGEFARNFLCGEARAGRLCIAGVVVDGVWSAHEIGIRTKGRMEGWLTHYDERVAKVQPGHQLIEWFANHHDDLHVGSLDQGVGVNAIKTTWARSGYDVLKLSAVPSAWTVSSLTLQVLRRVPPVLSCIRRTGSRLLSR